MRERTTESIDAELEQARLEMESKLVRAAPLAVQTLVDVMDDPEVDAGPRVSAAKEVIAQVRGRPGQQVSEQAQGPKIQVVIQKLFATGTAREITIPVSEAAMDAIESGVSPLADGD